MRRLKLKTLAWVRSELWKKIGFTGNDTFQLGQSDRGLEFCQVTEAGSSKLLIALVGRSICFEQEKHIPVDSWFEARAIAYQIPVSAPFEGVRKVRLSVSQSGGYDALITIIDIAKIEETLASRPWALIPISWVAPTLAGYAPAQINLAGESVGFYRSETKSTTMQLTSTAQCRDFWWALGVDPTSVSIVSQEESLQRVLPGLRQLTSAQWVEAFLGHGSRSTFDFAEFDWIGAGKVAGIFVASYLLLSSFFLVGLSTFSGARASEEPAAFLQALSVRREINQLIDQETDLRGVKAEQFPVWSIWPVLKDVSQQKVFVRSIQFDNGEVEVSYLADDATAVLNTIIKSPYATNVGFGAATRNDRRTGLDQFSVRWNVRDYGADDERVDYDG